MSEGTWVWSLGQGKIPMNGTSPQREHLTAEEAAAALAALDEAGWLRLRKIAAHRAAVRMEVDDLLQETCARLLGGSRHLPSDVPLIPAIDSIMQSIVLTELKGRQRHPLTSLSSAPGRNLGHDLDLPDPRGSAEDYWQQDQASKREAILVLFRGNEQATYAIEALAEGFTPQEIQSDLKIDQTQWNSLRRLIRRRINAAFPDGISL